MSNSLATRLRQATTSPVIHTIPPSPPSGPPIHLCRALELYSKGYRPTSNKYMHVSLGKDDYTRRMNRKQITLSPEEYRELKRLCRSFGEGLR